MHQLVIIVKLSIESQKGFKVQKSVSTFLIAITVLLLLIFTYYMLTKQGKVNYIKYKNKLITKITKSRAIVKPAKEPLAHEVSQSEFCIFFRILQFDSAILNMGYNKPLPYRTVFHFALI